MMSPLDENAPVARAATGSIVEVIIYVLLDGGGAIATAALQSPSSSGE
jgi:hypothetical protein